MILIILIFFAAVPTALWGIFKVNTLKEENRELRRELELMRQSDVQPPERPEPSYAPNRQIPAPYRPPADMKPSKQTGGPDYSIGPIPQKPREKVNPANVLLITGVTLITLAGLAFAVTSWKKLDTVFKIVLVFSQSALFFLVAALAHLKLKLRNTGLAFFVLGALYLPIAVLAAGVFELFGGWFSLYGQGRFVVTFLAALSLGGAAFAGVLIYRLRTFVWTSLLCLFAAVISAALIVRQSAGPAALTAASYCVIFVLAEKPLRLRFGGREGAASLFFAETTMIGTVQTAIGALGFLLVMSHGYMGAATAILFAAILIHPAFTRDLPIRGLSACPAVLYMMLGLYLFAPEGASWTSSLLITGVTAILIISAAGLIPETAGKILEWTALAVLVMVEILAFMPYEGWTPWMLLSNAILTVCVTILALRGDRLHKIIQPLLVAHCIWGLAVLLPLAVPERAIMSLLGAAAFFLYVFVFKTLRSPVSDSLFFLMTLAGLVRGDVRMQIIIILLAVAEAVIESKRYRGAAWAIPVLLMLMTGPLVELMSGRNWLAWSMVSLLLTALGLWSVLSKNRLASALVLPVTVMVPAHAFLVAVPSLGVALLSVISELPAHFLYWIDPVLVWILYIPAVPAAVLMVIKNAGCGTGESGKNMERMLIVWLYACLVFCLYRGQYRNELWLYLLLGALLSVIGVIIPLRWGWSRVNLPAVIMLYGFIYLLVPLVQGRLGLEHWDSNLNIHAPTLLFLLAGRLMYRKVWDREHRRIDWFTLITPLPILFLLVDGDTPVAYIFMIITALSFYRRTSSKYGDRISLTAVLGSACLTLWSLVLDYVPWRYETLLIVLPLLAAAAAAHLFVWKSMASRWVLFGLTILCTLRLAFEAISNDWLHYALILGIGALAVLIVSYLLRRKSWFCYSAVTLISLGLYFTRGFWASLAWWVYLLGAGIILLGLGAANERGKQKGGGLKSKFSRLWQDWQW